MGITRHDSAFADCLTAASDLSAKLHYLCTVDSSGKVDLCGAAGIVAGAITEGTAAGYGTSFSRGPIIKAVCGGTITAGQLCESDGNGKAVAGTTKPFGVARESGVSGDIISFSFDNR